MTRQELLDSVERRIIYLPGEDYYDKPYIEAKVVFCGIEFKSTVGAESINTQVAEGIARSNILQKVGSWLTKRELEEQERRLRDQSQEDADKDSLKVYLENLK